MSVGPRRRTSPLGDMLGRAGRIAGQAVAGGIAPEQRRISHPRPASATAPGAGATMLFAQIDPFVAATSATLQLTNSSHARPGSMVFISAEFITTGAAAGDVVTVEIVFAGVPSPILTMCVDPDGVARASAIYPGEVWNVAAPSGSSSFRWQTTASGTARLTVWAT